MPADAAPSPHLEKSHTTCPCPQLWTTRPPSLPPLPHHRTTAGPARPRARLPGLLPGLRRARAGHELLGGAH
jgi:hypothetical protein